MLAPLALLMYVQCWHGHLGHSDSATETASVPSSSLKPLAHWVALLPAGLDMQPLVLGYTPDAYQSLDEQQREYMDQQLDDFEEVSTGFSVCCLKLQTQMLN